MQAKLRSLRFLLDANMPRSMKNALKRLRVDVVDSRDILKPEASDREIFKLACRENRILVTRDLDFSNILLYPPKTHPGIIVMRTRAMKSKRINSLLEFFLKNVPNEHIIQRLVILAPRRFRIRK